MSRPGRVNRSETEQLAVRLGINPLTWTNDDMPELGADTPLESCLSEAREAGFVGIELGHKFPRRSATLRPILASYGLDLVSGWYSGRLLERSVAEEISAVEDHLRLLAEMGCAVMVYAEVTGSIHTTRSQPLSRRPTLADGDWAAYGERLTALAEHLAERGVRMAYHHHMGTVIESEEDIDRLMARTGNAVGLTLDTGHITYAGGDPVRTVMQHGRRINHVHCKDLRQDVLDRAKASDWSFLESVLESVFTVPGDGCVDFPKLCAALKDEGYEGWLVVEAEQDPAKAHPMTYAHLGHAGLTQAVLTAGL